MDQSGIVRTIVEITQSMIDTINPEEVVKIIQEAVITHFQAEGCSIGLLEESTGWLAFVAMEGKSKTDQFRIPPGRGFAGWVVEQGRGMLSNQPYEDKRFFDQIDRNSGFTTRNLICVPLLVENRVIGVIQALNTSKQDGFTEQDLQMLTTLGELAGAAITRTRKYSMTHSANEALQEVADSRYHLVGGNSPAMTQAIAMAKTVAQSNTTVLLISESGTGKEVIARAIHRWSKRASHPFIAVNCVALTQDLLASELFGHEKGAFTGAVAQKKGKFELADGGTIFLDEIGDLSMDLQVKLLRVLQDREFQRVGGSRDIHADVRIIAATNRDLKKAILEGHFREDLYYRLNVISLTLPPLRDRKEDIPELVIHFASRFAREMSRSPLKIELGAMNALQSYDWPGNVRELQNVIERAVVLAPQNTITVDVLPADILTATRSTRVALVRAEAHYQDNIPEDLPLAEAVELFKRDRVRRMLERTQGNQSKAARMLGLQPSNLSRFLRRHEP